MYKHSIFFAANSEAILKEQSKYKDLSWVGKVKVGASSSFLICVGLLFIPLLAVLSTKDLSDFNTKFYRNELIGEIKKDGVMAPIVEELLFRGVIQRIFQSIPFLSPAMQVIASNLFFSAMHLTNGGKGCVAQAILIFSLPVEAILYKTTSSMIAPMIAHMTNNIIIIIFANLFIPESKLLDKIDL